MKKKIFFEAFRPNIEQILEISLQALTVKNKSVLGFSDTLRF